MVPMKTGFLALVAVAGALGCAAPAAGPGPEEGVVVLKVGRFG
jgi:hypothetical protein